MMIEVVFLECVLMFTVVLSGCTVFVVVHNLFFLPVRDCIFFFDYIVMACIHLAKC